MSVRSVSLSDVSVGSRPTHIVIYQEGSSNVPQVATSNVNLDFLYNKIQELEKQIETLKTQMEKPHPSPFFGPTVTNPVGLDVRRLSQVSEAPLAVASIFDRLISSAEPSAIGPLPGNIQDTSIGPLPGNLEEDEELQANSPDQVEDEQVEGGDNEEDAEEEEEEEEGEAMELTEFQYKDQTYYRDADNQVYEKDEDGDLNDNPIGVWNEAKQKVLKYKTG
jgi:hypothetical protein